MTEAERKAREAGWYPTREAHVVFREATGVCRSLKYGDLYDPETDSYLRVPLRHAKNWDEAVRMDRL